MNSQIFSLFFNYASFRSIKFGQEAGCERMVKKQHLQRKQAFNKIIEIFKETNNSFEFDLSKVGCVLDITKAKLPYLAIYINPRNTYAMITLFHTIQNNYDLKSSKYRKGTNNNFFRRLKRIIEYTK